MLYTIIFSRIITIPNYLPVFFIIYTILKYYDYSPLFPSSPYHSPLHTLFPIIIIILHHSPLFSTIFTNLHCDHYSRLFPSIPYYPTIKSLSLQISRIYPECPSAILHASRDYISRKDNPPLRYEFWLEFYLVVIWQLGGSSKVEKIQSRSITVHIHVRTHIHMHIVDGIMY